ncbi:MAG: dehH1 2 [Myxococcaceae bacterium]|nr:dehH1 2 [Myxococcaceae bacterium]
MVNVGPLVRLEAKAGRAVIDDVELEYEVVGSGEPLLLIPGSNIAAGMAPLMRSLVEGGGFQIIRYHRRGMAGSSRGAHASVGVARQAEDALGLLRHLEIERAHVCGYSYGGVVAIELALTAPSSVRSLVLLEPILKSVASAQSFFASMRVVNERYAAGDAAGAIESTFEALGGPTWRELVEGAASGSTEQAIADASVFFELEAPSLATWSFDHTRATAFLAPLLSVVAQESGVFFGQGRDQLHAWFPRCLDADVPNATHMLNLQQPDAIAKIVKQFAL